MAVIRLLVVPSPLLWPQEAARPVWAMAMGFLPPLASRWVWPVGWEESEVWAYFPWLPPGESPLLLGSRLPKVCLYMTIIPYSSICSFPDSLGSGVVTAALLLPQVSAGFPWFLTPCPHSWKQSLCK